MSASKKIPTAFRQLNAKVGIKRFAMTGGGRFFGLDVGDWSVVFVGVALVGLLLTLV